jgi:glutathione S-transferase
MYTLYYSPGSVALLVNILLHELDVPFEARRVDLKAKGPETEAYLRMNPKGKVPALATPEGTLTESMALVSYVCDRHDPQDRLRGARGSWRRARIDERMATLATEIHPLFNRFFHADAFSDDAAVQAAVKARGTERLQAWFRQEDAALTQAFWSGDELSVADCFFVVVARWGRWLAPPANEMPRIRPFYERMLARPAVSRAFAVEGIQAYGTS